MAAKSDWKISDIEDLQRRSDDCTPNLHRFFELRNHPIPLHENPEDVIDLPLVLSQSTDKWQAIAQPVLSLAEEGTIEAFHTGLLKSRLIVKTNNHDPVYKIDLGAYHAGFHFLTHYFNPLPNFITKKLPPQFPLFLGGLVRFAYPEGYASPHAVQGQICYKTKKPEGLFQVSLQRIFGDAYSPRSFPASQGQMSIFYTWKMGTQDSSTPPFITENYDPFPTLKDYPKTRKFLYLTSYLFPIPKIPRIPKGIRFSPVFMSLGATADIIDENEDTVPFHHPTISVGISFPLFEDEEKKLIHFAGSELSWSPGKGVEASATVKGRVEQQAEGYLTARLGIDLRKHFYFRLSNE